ncbi:MAG: hypothetical protein AABY32_01375 [Nanoarchaeota archaeon]
MDLVSIICVHLEGGNIELDSVYSYDDNPADIDKINDKFCEMIKKKNPDISEDDLDDAVLNEKFEFCDGSVIYLKSHKIKKFYS